MIELNNKNITYVALADTNNSIKAPKEIWYADSNNSVKLVYRRKDALIEGEDYEKYHWLQGRNGAYIDTEHLVKTYEDVFEVYAKYDGTKRNPDGGEQNPFGIQDDNIRLASYIAGDNTINAVIKQNESTQNHNIQIHKDIFLITLYAPNSSEYVKILDGVSYTNPIDGTVNNDTNLKMYVFARNGKANSYFHGDIAYFKITDTSSDTKMSLIPCKLLKPVPKWLDANGIRRQVGECGMIDLVSGKFYGNVNSVGTFTVENYYERKEWLIAEISGVNTLMSLPIYSNKMQYTRVFVKFANIGYFLTTNNISYINISGVNIIYNNLTHTATSCGNSSLLSYIEVVCDSDSIVIDGELLENNLPVEKIQFYNASTTVDANFLTSKVTVDNKERYIPCTLTMDLPASMDANNIARTKGTSGMWDLVSDRFYGNVANSGTFKAVNLAEGVDYEEHEWLVGDGTAYIDTLITIPNEIVSVKTRIINMSNDYDESIIQNYNSFPFSNRNDAAPQPHVSVIQRRDLSKLFNDIFIPRQEISYAVGDIIEIDVATSRVQKGQSTLHFFYSDASNLIPKCWDGKISDFEVESLESVFKISLVPCRLLRPIPAKYDANGIARQVGECGMYDTVNDVFYGNVASSGTFSVSDDS